METIRTIRTRIARWLCPDVFVHRDIKTKENEDLTIKLYQSRARTKTLSEEVERLKGRNALLSKENEALLQRINNLRPVKRRGKR